MTTTQFDLHYSLREWQTIHNEFNYRLAWLKKKFNEIELNKIIIQRSGITVTFDCEQPDEKTTNTFYLTIKGEL